MFVEKLLLRNFRSYQSLDISLSPGINILTGPNNAGKSTIIRSIASLQNGLLELRSDDIRRTFNNAEIIIGFNDVGIEDHVYFGWANNPFHEHVGKNIFVQFELTKVGGQSNLNVKQADTLEDFKNTSHNHTKYKFTPFSSMESDNFFIYPFLSKRKQSHFSQTAGKETVYAITDTLQYLPGKITNISSPSHIRNEDYRKYCLDILGIIPGFIPNDIKQNESLGFFVNQIETVDLRSMGDGTLHVLGLLTILLTEDRKLLLIEEIENDIHPSALKKLLDLIIEKSKTNQVIVSTHSHIVVKHLASIKNTKLFYVENNLISVNGSRLPNSALTEIENTPEERSKILRKLGYELMDFDLYQAYLILEESSMERLIRDILIPIFAPELRLRLRTIAASGADDLMARFADFHRLFVYLHLGSPYYKEKVWVLADGDEAGLSNIDTLRQKYKSWPKDHFRNLKRNNLESYYPEKFKEEAKQVLNLKDKKLRKQKKEKLFQTVITWSNNNIEDAQIHYKLEMEEVISFLLEIQKIIILDTP